MNSFNAKFIVGTANFGLAYGIANGKCLCDEEVNSILYAISTHKLWGVDTSAGYGNAEEKIGEYNLDNKISIRVVTKIVEANYSRNPELIRVKVNQACKKLNKAKLEFLLIHSFETYQRHKQTLTFELNRLKSDGLIGNWGVSLYHPEEVLELLEDGVKELAFECPFNLFDRRFEYSNAFTKIKKVKGTIIARSIFLQGLFFCNPENLNSFFYGVKPQLKLLHSIALNHKTTIATLALDFVLENPLIDYLVIGVDSHTQLIDNVKDLNHHNQKKINVADLNKLSVTDNSVLLPYLWPKK